MSPFFGTDTYAIDHKGRLAIPAGMRRGPSERKPQDRFILLAGLDGGLWLYTPEVFEVVWGEKIRRWQAGDRRRREFVRAFLMDAREVSVDTQGRVTIPPALLGRAGLGKEAVLLGTYSRIEIWSPERHARAESLRDRLDAGEDDDLLREDR